MTLSTTGEASQATNGNLEQREHGETRASYAIGGLEQQSFFCAALRTIVSDADPQHAEENQVSGHMFIILSDLKTFR